MMLPEAGDRSLWDSPCGTATGDRRPETGDRRPETGDRNLKLIVAGTNQLMNNDELAWDPVQ
ncbi:hypothetical protein [Tunicatimonas pelagia]|uniref:hypothetical protein n=1 Tax=Tunicatimonas pelagia TaxID=931531 RepID=UPI002666A727|nr:hypothetical protein [Tunicatimonas pelagia]WKN41861.1 hypothetical protein P0M28_22740 [Tunicatimonas pelagia]